MQPASPRRKSARAERLAQLREALVRAAGNAQLIAELRAELAALKRTTPPEFTRLGVELEAIAARLQRVGDALAQISDGLQGTERERDKPPPK